MSKKDTKGSFQDVSKPGRVRVKDTGSPSTEEHTEKAAVEEQPTEGPGADCTAVVDAPVSLPSAEDLLGLVLPAWDRSGPANVGGDLTAVKQPRPAPNIFAARGPKIPARIKVKPYVRTPEGRAVLASLWFALGYMRGVTSVVEKVRAEAMRDFTRMKASAINFLRWAAARQLEEESLAKGHTLESLAGQSEPKHTTPEPKKAGDPGEIYKECLTKVAYARQLVEKLHEYPGFGKLVEGHVLPEGFKLRLDATEREIRDGLDDLCAQFSPIKNRREFDQLFGLTADMDYKANAEQVERHFWRLAAGARSSATLAGGSTPLALLPRSVVQAKCAVPGGRYVVLEDTWAVHGVFKELEVRLHSEIQTIARLQDEIDEFDAKANDSSLRTKERQEAFSARSAREGKRGRCEKKKIELEGKLREVEHGS